MGNLNLKLNLRIPKRLLLVRKYIHTHTLYVYFINVGGNKSAADGVEIYVCKYNRNHLIKYINNINNYVICGEKR